MNIMLLALKYCLQIDLALLSFSCGRRVGIQISVAFLRSHITILIFET